MNITKSQIQKAVREAVFTPKKEKIWKFVTEMNDPNYCVKRATELLNNMTITRQTVGSRQQIITQAISLLALAKVQYETNAQT